MPDKPLATRNKPHNNQLCADLSRFISAYSVVSHFLRFAWQTTDDGNVVDLLINSNTTDRVDYPMSAYGYTDIRLIKIIGYNDK